MALLKSLFSSSTSQVLFPKKKMSCRKISWKVICRFFYLRILVSHSVESLNNFLIPSSRQPLIISFNSLYYFFKSLCVKEVILSFSKAGIRMNFCKDCCFSWQVALFTNTQFLVYAGYLCTQYVYLHQDEITTNFKIIQPRETM